MFDKKQRTIYSKTYQFWCRASDLSERINDELDRTGGGEVEAIAKIQDGPEFSNGDESSDLFIVSIRGAHDNKVGYCEKLKHLEEKQ